VGKNRVKGAKKRGRWQLVAKVLNLTDLLFKGLANQIARILSGLTK
jgi:hypothetical protein